MPDADFIIPTITYFPSPTDMVSPMEYPSVCATFSPTRASLLRLSERFLPFRRVKSSMYLVFDAKSIPMIIAIPLGGNPMGFATLTRRITSPTPILFTESAISGGTRGVGMKKSPL